MMTDRAKFEQMLELREILDAIARLPAPVVPVAVGRVREEALAEGTGARADREARSRTTDFFRP